MELEDGIRSSHIYANDKVLGNLIMHHYPTELPSIYKGNSQDVKALTFGVIAARDENFSDGKFFMERKKLG